MMGLRAVTSLNDCKVSSHNVSTRFVEYFSGKHGCFSEKYKLVFLKIPRDLLSKRKGRKYRAPDGSGSDEIAASIAFL